MHRRVKKEKKDEKRKLRKREITTTEHFLPLDISASRFPRRRNVVSPTGIKFDFFSAILFSRLILDLSEMVARACANALFFDSSHTLAACGVQAHEALPIFSETPWVALPDGSLKNGYNFFD